MFALPETGFLRLRQIIGDPKATPPLPGLYPISKSAWWDGVRRGIYPKSVKLGPRTTAWKAEDIALLLEAAAANAVVGTRAKTASA